MTTWLACLFYNFNIFIFCQLLRLLGRDFCYANTNKQGCWQIILYKGLTDLKGLKLIILKVKVKVKGIHTDLKGLKLIILNVLFCNFSIFETDYFVPKFENHKEVMKKFHDKPWKVFCIYSV